MNMILILHDDLLIATSRLSFPLCNLSFVLIVVNCRKLGTKILESEEFLSVQGIYPVKGNLSSFLTEQF